MTLRKFRSEGRAVIYAMTMQEGKFVKIGYTATDDLERRAAQLQTGSPFYLKPEFSVDGTLRQEQALHGALKTAFYRIRIKVPGNEWYPAKNPFMREFVDTLRTSGANAALAFAEKYNPAVRQWGTSQKFAVKNAERERAARW